MSEPDTEFDWQAAAQAGTLDELHRWARDNHHVNLTDAETVLSLAANAITDGAWRNNSELEDIHAGAYKRPGQKQPRGLSDTEMMIGNIETAKTVRRYLATGRPWWYLDIGADLFNYDRPYAGTPLTEHVTKKVLASHTKRVQKNLWLYHLIEDLVGPDRFLAGLALTALSSIHWGSPQWPTQVTTWAAQTDPAPSAQVIEQMQTDPTGLSLPEIETALRTGLGYAHGRERWHQDHCGDPHHRLEPDVTRFLGLFHSVWGMPMSWGAAAVRKLTESE